MNINNHILSVFVWAVLLNFTCFFASANKSKNTKEILGFVEVFQDGELTIYKKHVNKLDVYTFTPKNQIDKDLILAIENRLKATNQAVVSFFADDKNLVTLIIDPEIITEENLKLTLAIAVKIHGYSPYDYKIEEL